MVIVFLLAFFFIIYHLFFYGMILQFISIFKKQQSNVKLTEFPTITVLCPAYNEEDVIEKKIHSFLALNYPKDKIEMIVISDDSTDNTNEIVSKYTKENNIELIIQKPRKGKQSGHNLVEPLITSDYVLSTDANSIFHPMSVKELVKVILSDEKIGMVTGQLILLKNHTTDSSEGLYWKYESWLKRLESNLYSIVCANGSLFLIKRELFKRIHPASADDFERTLYTLKYGYKIKYAPTAIVTENVSEKASDEIKRKIRIISQEWFVLKRQLGVFKNITAGLFLLSHKLIRWTFPIYCLAILITSGLLIRNELFLIIFLGQVILYIIGFLEILNESRFKSFGRIFKIPAYFVAMNYAAIIAFYKFLHGQQSATWNNIR